MKLSKYPNYKDSNIEWLGEVPEHWEVRRNKSVFYEASKLSKTGAETLLTVSHITGVTPRSEKNVNMFFAETMEGYKICQEGDLIINTMWAWMGALGTSRYYGICSPAYNVYRSIKGVDYDARYFDYLFKIPEFVVEMTKYSKGIVESRLRLYPKDFFRINTPLPPKAEQTAIANYLDATTQTLDKKVSLLEQKIKYYEELKKAIINETVTKGLDKNVILKDSGVDYIGQIPQHWEVKRFKDVANTTKGKTLGSSETQFPNYLPLLTLEYLRNSESISQVFVKNDNKNHKVKEEDYIIVWDGAGVGDILKGRIGYLSSTIAKIRFNKREIIPKYFYHTRILIEKILKNNPSGMGIPHLDPILLVSINLPLPQLTEQIEIAEYLDI